MVQTSCAAEEQRIHMRQDRFTIRDSNAALQRWQVPVALGPLRALQRSETVLLAGESEIVAGRCGEPVKLNLADIGYYRVEDDGASRAALAKSLALMAPPDRLNMLADSWALLQASPSESRAYFERLDEIGNDDDHPAWEQ